MKNVSTDALKYCETYIDFDDKPATVGEVMDYIEKLHDVVEALRSRDWVYPDVRQALDALDPPKTEAELLDELLAAANDMAEPCVNPFYMATRYRKALKAYQASKERNDG